MSVTNEADLKMTDQVKVLIHEEVRKQVVDKHETACEKDPYGVYDAVAKRYGDIDVKSFKTDDVAKRSIPELIDLSHRVREWLDNSGTVWSDKAQKVLKMSIADAVHSKDMHMLFPKVVSSIVIEHSEPESNVLSLYERINFQNGTSITFPVWSPGGMSLNLTMPEVGEPNELTGDFSSFISATTGKVGIKASITEDTMRFSIIDLYRLQLKWCGQALGRFKEKLAVQNLINAAANNVLADNINGGGLVSAYTHGRNFNGGLNGTLAKKDIFDAWAYAFNRGANLDTIVIHPLAWRALIGMGLNGIPTWQKPSNVTNGSRHVGKGLNKLFNPGYTTASVDGTHTTTEATINISNGVFGMPFKVMVTPYLPVRRVTATSAAQAGGGGTTTATDYLTDILLIDSRDVGVLVVDQDLYIREETKMFDQIKETAMFERYGFGSSNLANGLYTIKNVLSTEAYDFQGQPIVRTITSLGAEATPVTVS